jgi:DNA-binding transcriptional LysR family regulator
MIKLNRFAITRSQTPMNTAALQAFVMVMQTGSVSRAAERLHLTQPAISKRLRTLEDEFGVRLFDAVGRGIQPTQAAHTLWPLATRWLLDYNDIRHSLSHAQDQVSGRLMIGTSHHIGLHHLPSALKTFVQRYPAVELDVHFVDSEQAHQAVLSGELELAFLTLPPTPHARLSYVEIWPDPLQFVAAPFHPLAQQQGPLTLRDLMPYPALLPDANTYTSQITLAAFAQQHLKPQASMSTNPLESLRMLASIGLGWSVLPQTLLTDELAVLPMIDVAPLSRMLGMVWHPERTRSQAADRLCDHVLHDVSHTVPNNRVVLSQFASD